MKFQEKKKNPIYCDVDPKGILNMLTLVKVRILEEIILIPALRSCDVTMHEGKWLLAAVVIFFKEKTK